jgi:hypothetical protein
MAEGATLHKRIDDLRDDTTRSIETLRSGMNSRFDDMDRHWNSRFDDINKRIDDIHRRFSTQAWLISTWFTLLTLLTILFKFIK